MSPGITKMASAKGGRVDALLAKQGKADKVLLRRRIEFRQATQSDGKMDLLRKKYRPINAAAEASKHSTGKAGLKGSKKGTSETIPGTGGLVDSSGFRRAENSLFAGERLSDGWRSVRAIGPGLNNLGNTCFLNSVLQCLTYTAPLAEYLMAHEHSGSCRMGDSCILCRFEAQVTHALAKRSGSAVSPKPIVGRLKLVAKHMRIGRQEDAHEFLRLLVDSFQRSLLHGIDPKIDRRVQETTLVHQIFGGYLQSQVTCSKCDYDSNTFDPLLDISLDIQSGSSLTKALRAFTRPEHLVKANRYKCEKCSKLVDATKQMSVYKLPRILTLQLKRFSIFGGGKINRFVEFPLHLSMKNYVSRNSPEHGPYDYSLYAVLVHAGGTSRSGHYYCFVKSPAGVWYEMNDSMVRQVSENTVLKQTAYLLFYERSAKDKDGVPDKHKRSAAEPKPAVVADESKPKPKPKHTANGSAKASGKIAAASDDMELELGKSLARASKLEAKKLRKKAKKLEKQRERQKKAVAQDPSLKSASQELGRLAAPASNAAPSVGQTQEAVTKAISQGIASDEASSDWVVRNKRGPSDAPASPGKRAKTSGPGVAVVEWDEDTASKRAKATALAELKSSKWSVKEMRLNRKSQYGAAVSSWDGSEAAPAETDRKHKSKKMHRPDTWNAEYDRGRVKKVKKGKRKVFTDTINPFQVLGERQSAKK